MATITAEQQAKIAEVKAASKQRQVDAALARGDTVSADKLAAGPISTTPGMDRVTTTPTTDASTIPRNPEAEAQTIASLGFTPTSDKDIVDMAHMTYGDNLPADLQALADKQAAEQAQLTSLSGGGVENATGLQTLGQDINASGTQASDLKSQVEAQGAQIPGQLNGLQNALKIMSGVGNQPLGTSEVFKAAGVGGYGALQSSLAARGAEMDFRYNSLNNLVKSQAAIQFGQNKTDLAKAQGALDKYALLIDEHRYQTDRLDKINERAQALDDEIYLYGEKAKIDADYAAAAERSSSLGNGSGVTTTQASEIFTIPGVSKYRKAGEWECAEAFNKITDGGKAGTDWSTKIGLTLDENGKPNQGLPEVGNGLAIPIGDTAVGHFETVINVSSSGVIQTGSWNRNLDGQQTVQTYTLDELNDKYGKNWGFSDSKLKPEYEQALASSTGGISPDSISPSQIAQFNEYFVSGGKTVPPQYKGDEEAFAELANQFIEMSTDKNVSLEDTMYYSRGRKELTDTPTASIAKNILTADQISELEDKFNDLGDGEFGPILGIISSKNPYDTKAQEIKAMLQTIVPNLARGVYGEVGVLTDNDIQNYMKTLPNLTSTEDVRNAVLEMTKKTIARGLESRLKTYSATYDVSNYGWVISEYGLGEPEEEVVDEDEALYDSLSGQDDPEYQEGKKFVLSLGIGSTSPLNK